LRYLPKLTRRSPLGLAGCQGGNGRESYDALPPQNLYFFAFAFACFAFSFYDPFYLSF
jgi:hypothetical protein